MRSNRRPDDFRLDTDNCASWRRIAVATFASTSPSASADRISWTLARLDLRADEGPKREREVRGVRMGPTFVVSCSLCFGFGGTVSGGRGKESIIVLRSSSVSESLLLDGLMVPSPTQSSDEETVEGLVSFLS